MVENEINDVDQAVLTSHSEKTLTLSGLYSGRELCCLFIGLYEE